MVEWYAKDLWRAHVAWLTPAWVGTVAGRKDFNAKRLLDQLQKAHFRTFIFYSKFHDGYCIFPSKYREVKPERDFLGEISAEAHKRGMRIVVYYSTVPDTESGLANPEWGLVSRDGITPPRDWFVDHWIGCCINNPGYHEFVLGQLKEMRDNYHVDGFWMDIFGHEGCFCESCQAKYREDSGGGSLLDLDDTKRGLWRLSCFENLLREIRAIIKENNPDGVVLYNGAMGFQKLDKLVDCYSSEGHDERTIALLCRLARPSGKPFECTSFTLCEAYDWGTKSTDLILLESAAQVAHGGMVSIIIEMAATGWMSDDQIDQLAEVGDYIRKQEPYLLDTEPVYDAALFAAGHGGPDGWISVFLERDIPFALLHAGADLSPYRLVVLNDTLSLSEDLAKSLVSYVREGGNLIVECDAAGFGRQGGDILSEVLGIRCQGRTGYEIQFLSRLDDRIASDMMENFLGVEGEAYKIELTTAEALAYYTYPIAAVSPDRYIFARHNSPRREASNDPAITTNRYGTGRAMYIGCPLGTKEIRGFKKRRAYPTQLAANLARFMIGKPLFRSATPPGVEVIVNSQEGRHIVHLLNNYLTPGQFYDNRHDVMKLADVPICINEERIGMVKRAFRLSGNEELPMKRDGEWLEVMVPRLTVHEMIVLEH